MDIKSVKLELMERLLLTESEELLEKIQSIFSDEKDFALSDVAKRELDLRKQRYLNEEGASYSWDEVKAKAQNSKK
ncbi:hypothetical protein Oweho_1719 [Owenweeksia hongkongensis DSM 17368]|uniref:Addiction module component n=1 Tax=Owenweeksia hongkongensis (strain DSM 17368 / CIP 108786 / JCM 12287 / NRRL B-23963 / UST20020801) TaxID=926562 RepID=G8R0K3_OWEHD|nr:hypothetical protein [Owenweeksia hongkongensis]AEV32707.1 hypothetical protein Oweho_1719 [Owenweeksia hongkongensis DSM 17368]